MTYDLLLNMTFMNNITCLLSVDKPGRYTRPQRAEQWKPAGDTIIELTTIRIHEIWNKKPHKRLATREQTKRNRSGNQTKEWRRSEEVGGGGGRRRLEDGRASWFYLLMYARNLLDRVILLYFLVIGHNRVLTDNIHKSF